MRLYLFDNSEILLYSVSSALPLTPLSNIYNCGYDKINKVNTLGSLLIDFLETDFSNKKEYIKLVNSYSLDGLFPMSSKDETDLMVAVTLQQFDNKARNRILSDAYSRNKGYFIEAQNELKQAISISLSMNMPEAKFKNDPAKLKEYLSLPYIKRLFVYEQLYGNASVHKIFSNKLQVTFTTIPNIPDEVCSLLIRRDFYYDNTDIEAINNIDFRLAEVYESNDLAAICYITFIKMLLNDTPLKQCLNCGRFFLIEKDKSSGRLNRSDTEYCNRIAPGFTNKTCKDIGPIKEYQHKIRNDEYLNAYQNTYKSKHARLRKITNPGRRDLEKVALSNWRVQAKEKALAKTMTLDEYKAWLKNS